MHLPSGTCRGGRVQVMRSGLIALRVGAAAIAISVGCGGPTERSSVGAIQSGQGEMPSSGPVAPGNDSAGGQSLVCERGYLRPTASASVDFQAYHPPTPLLTIERRTASAECQSIVPVAIPDPVRVDRVRPGPHTVSTLVLGTDGQGAVFIGSFGTHWEAPGISDQILGVYTPRGQFLGTLFVGEASEPVWATFLRNGVLTTFRSSAGCELRRYDDFFRLVWTSSCLGVPYGGSGTEEPERLGFFVHPDGSAVDVLVDTKGVVTSEYIGSDGAHHTQVVVDAIDLTRDGAGSRRWLGAAQDSLGRILLVRSAGPPDSPWPQTQFLVARWLDPMGLPMTDHFRPSDEPYRFPAAPFLQRLAGGGLALQDARGTSWKIVIGSGSTEHSEAPRWLAEGAFRPLSLVKSGAAYFGGIVSETASDPERYELISSSGISCATFRVEEPGGPCDDGAWSVGMDGTFLRQSRRSLLTQAGDTSTAFFWWSGLFK